MATLQSSPASDRNLLFGILALQMDFISRDTLIRAMHAWVLQKTTPLGQILLEQQALSAEEHDLLHALVQKHIQKHGGDVQKSLATLNTTGPCRIVEARSLAGIILALATHSIFSAMLDQTRIFVKAPSGSHSLSA
jgi:hypothetical protein